MAAHQTTSWITAAGCHRCLPAWLLLAAVAGCDASSSETAATRAETVSTEPQVVVRVLPVQRRVIAETIDAWGRCEALPEKLALLTAAVEGQVSAIRVRRGESVARGQAVVELDPTLARADLSEKKAARDSLVAALGVLRSLPREKEQEAAKLAIQQAEIAVARARALVERLRPLRARNEVSEPQMFEAEQAVAQAQLQLRTAVVEFEVLMLGPRQEAVAEAEAKIRAAEEAVATSQARLDLLTLRAPIEGVLDSLTCSPGQTLPVGTVAGTVVDSRELLVTAWLPIASGKLVRKGQTARVRTANRPSAAASSSAKATAEHGELSGEVVFVGRIADPQTGNVPIHVRVDNPQQALVIGQTLEVIISVGKQDAALVVPQSAIQDEGQGPSLTVVRNGKSVLLHPTLGASHGGWVAVSTVQLKEGEAVIVDGAYNLPEGTAVKTTPADSH